MIIQVHVKDSVVVGDGGSRDPVFVDICDEPVSEIVDDTPVLLSAPYYEYIESRGPPVDTYKGNFATAACGHSAYRRIRVYGGYVA